MCFRYYDKITRWPRTIETERLDDSLHEKKKDRKLILKIRFYVRMLHFFCFYSTRYFSRRAKYDNELHLLCNIVHVIVNGHV